MTTRVFSDEELEGLRSFPAVGKDELIRYFTLTPADTAFLARFRRAQNVLGAAVQLATLPRLGFVPDDVPSAPPPRQWGVWPAGPGSPPPTWRATANVSRPAPTTCGNSPSTWDRVARDPADPSRLRADLQVGDWLHLDRTGHGVPAGEVPTGLFGR